MPVKRSRAARSRAPCPYEDRVDASRAPGKGRLGVEKSETVKKVAKNLAISHFFEALIAARAAGKRGKNPKSYFVLTWIFGVFVLIPLLRKPKLEAA